MVEAVRETEKALESIDQALRLQPDFPQAQKLKKRWSDE